MRVVLFKGTSQYDGTRLFIDAAASALAGRGYAPQIVDLAEAASPEAGAFAAATGWRDLPAGIATMKALHDDPAAAFAQARAGKARVLAEHTWDSRIGLVLRAAGL